MMGGRVRRLLEVYRAHKVVADARVLCAFSVTVNLLCM